jgi:ribosomal protein S18 acetylase RimI-like enzyme
LALTPWTEEQKQAFLELQFSIQDAHYRTYYPTASFLVIEWADTAVGRLYIDQWASEVRIMDVSLLPEYRGKGIGTQLFTQLQEEAALEGKVLSIHVDKQNPALRLYQRLGFRTKQEKGMYLLMEWSSEE